VKFWKIIKGTFIFTVSLLVIFIVAGFFIPFSDREGVCSVCGMKIYEKQSDWFEKPFRYTRITSLSNYYQSVELPDHEHNWEYLGGVVKTNLYGFPAVYDLERSDPLLLVPQRYIIDVLEKLEKRNAQIELLRALNSTDEGLKDSVRTQLYESFPGKMERFLEWWELVMESREGITPSEILPGPVWEKRLKGVDEVPVDDPESPPGQAHLTF